VHCPAHDDIGALDLFDIFLAQADLLAQIVSGLFSQLVLVDELLGFKDGLVRGEEMERVLTLHVRPESSRVGL
jgi:hypothetical protein